MMLIPLMVQAQHKSVWNIPAADYPSLDDHNMVTFKVYAPDAKDVKISISEKEYPMQKDNIPRHQRVCLLTSGHY